MQPDVAEHKIGRFLLNTSRKRPILVGFYSIKMAERAGFEPAIPQRGIPVFETGAFNHSATSPRLRNCHCIRWLPRSGFNGRWGRGHRIWGSTHPSLPRKRETSGHNWLFRCRCTDFWAAGLRLSPERRMRFPERRMRFPESRMGFLKCDCPDGGPPLNARSCIPLNAAKRVL